MTTQASSAAEWPSSFLQTKRIPRVAGGLHRSLFLAIALATVLGGAALTGSVTSTVTMSAAITVALTVLAVFAAPNAWARAGTYVHRATIPFVLSLVWAILVTIHAGHVGKLGFQNLCVYTIFLLFVVVTSTKVRPGVVERFALLIIPIGWAVALVYGITFVTKGFDASGIFPRRAFPMEAVIIMAMVVPSSDRRWRARALPYLLAAEVAGSGSRTATVVAAFLLAFMALRGRGSLRKTFMVGVRLAVLSAAIVWSVNNISYVHDRVFGGDTSLLGINTEGRSQLWSAVIADARQHDEWVGQGAGSAEVLLASDGFPASGGGPVEPHNDYLRMWHDFGWVGAALFFSGFLGLAARMLIMRRRVKQEIYLSAIFVILGALVIMTTDNIVVYWFAMLPIATIVGLALGTATSDRSFAGSSTAPCSSQ